MHKHQAQSPDTNELDDSFEESDGHNGNFTTASVSERRKIAASSNWGKIRDVLLTARIEESSFPEESNCVVCRNNVASIRCENCGPRQYFCMKSTQEIHEKRNKFHVLEQWQVNTGLHIRAG